MQHYQLIDQGLLIPKVAHERLVKEISMEFTSNLEPARFNKSALDAIQIATEAFLVSEFNGAAFMMAHAKRATVMQQDMKAVRTLRERFTTVSGSGNLFGVTTDTRPLISYVILVYVKVGFVW